MPSMFTFILANWLIPLYRTRTTVVQMQPLSPGSSSCSPVSVPSCVQEQDVFVSN
ncbi:hypothetical protein M404DRAFT_998722 [Pisolithus tinctorius Marx 270]|uniref:Uncharacterized protein n=1 Tax=Pisolithus tinctorius Marx 270 TaxID=870435 RepID=A0A0C3PEE7_PISTI|nr:hypothetical protein M404DRAFT_998722 [Pisolithus tinctorius Marx 270]